MEQKNLAMLNFFIMIASFSVYKARVIKQNDIQRLFIEELTYINYVKVDKIIQEFIDIL